MVAKKHFKRAFKCLQCKPPSRHNLIFQWNAAIWSNSIALFDLLSYIVISQYYNIAQFTGNIYTEHIKFTSFRDLKGYFKDSHPLRNFRNDVNPFLSANFIFIWSHFLTPKTKIIWKVSANFFISVEENSENILCGLSWEK